MKWSIFSDDNRALLEKVKATHNLSDDYINAARSAFSLAEEKIDAIKKQTSIINRAQQTKIFTKLISNNRFNFDIAHAKHSNSVTAKSMLVAAKKIDRAWGNALSQNNTSTNSIAGLVQKLDGKLVFVAHKNGKLVKKVIGNNSKIQPTNSPIITIMKAGVIDKHRSHTVISNIANTISIQKKTKG